MSTIFGSTTAGVVLLILIALVIGLLFVMLNINLRMSRLQKRYRLFMKGADGQSVEKAMAGKLIELGKLRVELEETKQTLKDLQNLHGKMLCKYGVVKYDAFEDVGGKMSFALAMLDENNTGFVLNAIHSRDNCFLYLKDVVKGTSYIMLSDEEIEALRRAAKFGEDATLEEKTKEPKKKLTGRRKATGKSATTESAAGGNIADEHAKGETPAGGNTAGSGEANGSTAVAGVASGNAAYASASSENTADASAMSERAMDETATWTTPPTAREVAELLGEHFATPEELDAEEAAFAEEGRLLAGETEEDDELAELEKFIAGLQKSPDEQEEEA